jgi:perosamine synthetase
MSLTESDQKSSGIASQSKKNVSISIAQPFLAEEEIASVASILRSGMLAQGSYVREFENQFAAYIGTKEAVAVNSGTAALHAALAAVGVGPGDEVITTPFSFIATANAILFCNAKPVFADIEADTFNISPDRIEEKITTKTKAIIIVHLYGLPCDMGRIMAICHRHHLALIEDSCQAHGAAYQGQKVGSFGIGCFSFYPTKNMTTGEGGMVTTNDPAIAEKIRIMRSHGQTERYRHDILGYNYRMTEIAAAIGIAQLAKLDVANYKRIKNAQYFSETIATEGIVLPKVPQGYKHVFHQFTVRITPDCGVSRKQLQQALQNYGIDSAVHYPIPIHKQPIYLKLGYDENLPVAEKAANQVLSLPIHPLLTEGNLARIAVVVAHVR